MDVQQLAEFFGWCTVINAIFLILAWLIMQVFAEPIKALHRRMFTLDDETLQCVYFKFFGYYKLAIYVFNLAPYIALKLMV
ncbi:hypothetical protein E2K93_11355 [Thalassotalea sp. HSM 43]|uniref:DUF6868 family protein n=1 Tax=Thalassotalea sp. HSM 43 TaxID=2552945 RepID=UPI00108180C9|nr:hypothetical protein [Thalassotalea sp. HSM 43]QBY04942.1 hypothetical protein E2K93_11355 [Thalassotalea sp. HSM 43]